MLKKRLDLCFFHSKEQSEKKNLCQNSKLPLTNKISHNNEISIGVECFFQFFEFVLTAQNDEG